MTLRLLLRLSESSSMPEDSPSLVLEVVGSLGRPINLKEKKKEKRRDEKLRCYQYMLRVSYDQLFGKNKLFLPYIYIFFLFHMFIILYQKDKRNLSTYILINCSTRINHCNIFSHILHGSYIK